MKYNYYDAIENDIIDAISDYAQYEDTEIINSIRDGLDVYDELFTYMWLDDSVTGNASGSYYCNTWKAEESLCHNMELLGHALYEFGCENVDPLEKGAEWCDVTIRCFLLGEVLQSVLDDIYYGCITL